MPGFAGQNVTAGLWNDGTVQVSTKAGLATLNPANGMQAWVTDLAVPAFYNTGTASWVYGAQQIGAVVLGASAASMGVSGISPVNQIMIVYTGRQDSGSGGAYTFLQLNADSASHYAYQNLVGSGASAAASNGGALGTGIRMGVTPGSGDTANYFGAGTIMIGNAQSAVFKPASCSYASAVSATSGYVGQTGGLWASTAAVTSVKLLPNAGNFVAGSSLSVYALM